MRISLDKEVPPNVDVKFKVKLTLDDFVEFSGAELGFRAPPAIKALNRLSFKIKEQKTSEVIETSSLTFNFSTLKKDQNIDRRIYLTLPRPQNGLGQIKKNQRITFDIPSGSPVSILDSRQGIITKVQTPSNYYRLTVTISSGVWEDLPLNSTSLTNHKFEFQNQRIISRKKRYRFLLDASIRNELINKDNVKDVMVFGYKQFNDGIDASDAPRYYMIDADAKIAFNLDQPTPKDLSDTWFINEAGQQKNNIPRNFDLNDGTNFIFFCTAVRYIQDKDTGEWTADWIQKNSRGRPVFAVNRSVENDSS